MRKPLFYFVMAVVLLAGCRREDVGRLKATAQTLQNANKIIQEGNLMIQDALMEKLRDPVYHAYAEIWEPKASHIKRKADSIVTFIEELKNELIRQSDSLRVDKAPLIAQLRATDGPGYKLISRLAAFKDSFQAIINAEDLINTRVDYANVKKEVPHLYSIVPLLPAYSNNLNAAQRKQYAMNWLEDNFLGTSAVMAMVVLNRIENDLIATTRAFMKFCLDQMPVVLCGWRGFRGVAILNSSYVKQGQSIEVSAGIGEFNVGGSPRITIGGKKIELNTDAVAVHQFIAAGKPGKNKIRVEFEFTKPDGSTEHVYKDLKYIIADEK